jgi:hypothetical protein
MRSIHRLAALVVLVAGLALGFAVLYDATELTRLAGLAPEGGEGGEAAVALGGLAGSMLAVGFGARRLRRTGQPAPTAR